MNASRIVAAVIFDLDGTLVDSVPALEDAYGAFLSARGRMPSRGEFIEMNGPSISEIVGELKRRHALAEPIADLSAAYGELVNRAYRERVRPFAGAEALLRRCRALGFRLALATAAPRRVASELLERLGWSEWFARCVGGDEVMRAKPHPDLYALCLARLAIQAGEAVAVEDSEHGEAAARAAGLEVLRVDARRAAVPTELLRIGEVLARMAPAHMQGGQAAAAARRA